MEQFFYGTSGLGKRKKINEKNVMVKGVRLMLLCFKRRFFFHLPDAFLTHTGGSEDGKKTKSARALDARDAGEDDSDGLDQRDRLEDGDENDDDTAKAPPGFLSPSVREYLELGRSIPGMKKKKPLNRFFFLLLVSF